MEFGISRCSVCQRTGSMCICGGCKTVFCLKDFNEHRQQLSNRFDHDIVRFHDELLSRMKQINDSSNELFTQINRWEATTIDKIHKAAESARQKLNKMLNYEKEIFKEQFANLTKQIRFQREENSFVENDIQLLKHKLNKMQQSLRQLTGQDKSNIVLIENSKINWNNLIYLQKQQLILPSPSTTITLTTKWTQNGLTVAGGYRKGSGFNQLYCPNGFFVDDNLTVYIADFSNNRIVEWKFDSSSGLVIAGENGQGNRTDQLDGPIDVILDKEKDSFIICDKRNRRVLKWPYRGGTSGQTIIPNIDCACLTIDQDGFIYVSDIRQCFVKRWKIGETQGTIVAGGNGKGDRLDQLNSPTFLFVDREQSVYVADRDNHRVMKWPQNAQEGIMIAGGEGQGNTLTQLSSPCGILVDQLSNLYIADRGNHRVVRWAKDSDQGTLIVGGNGQGQQSNQLNEPKGIAFDRHGNLYVADCWNHRIQRFSIDSNPTS
ncbi:unnamed protein product [Rotaria magnacalcarata]|uniref:Uncharacterized protein n=1 Tax=Rotaria magnacalcarata TaxID=392030 RepID=A0A816UZM3_9BILA|nr:unnamed protein product [Rotaria magnacalcarata]CAF1490941.1 unnamed protein product [Rotaria magnacalcarata]CAF2039691.1 unnamed protein product [Rotaria magnacalcarata]CAF2116510.1 unnamed protein product [Rotaria magnacalcarata]CAF3900267.1 unnamed protein product [Rotaria magnacalcarata]